MLHQKTDVDEQDPDHDGHGEVGTYVNPQPPRCSYLIAAVKINQQDLFKVLVDLMVGQIGFLVNVVLLKLFIKHISVTPLGE
jgi:hypothetical protein